MHFGATQKFKMTNDNQIQVYKTFVSSGYNNIIPILRLRYNPNANYFTGFKYTFDQAKWNTDGKNNIMNNGNNLSER